MSIGSFTPARCLTFRSAVGARRLLPLAGLLLFAAVPLRAQRVVATLPAGTAPGAAAVNPVTNRTYIANFSSANVTVIDGATHGVSTIATGNGPIAIAINPATNRIYVANNQNSSVTMIDGASGFTTAIPVGVNPYGIALNPVTNKIYVSNSGGTAVTVIDGWSNTVLTTVSVGGNPRGVAVNPVTNRVYVANNGSFSISVIDGASDTVLTTIPTPGNPESVAVNPVTNRIYVSDGNGFGAVDVINGADNTIVSLPLAGPQNSPRDVAVNPLTNKIYIANRASGSITVVDGATNGLTYKVVGATPTGLAIDPSANLIYVPNSGNTTLIVIDGATLDAVELTVGTGPRAAVVNPLTHRVYVANGGSNNVSVIDGAQNGVATIAVGTNPVGVAANPVTNKIYVANRDSDSITVIDGATEGTTTIPVGAQPYAVAVNSLTNKIYVANMGNNSVTVIDGVTSGTTTVAVGINPVAVAVNPLTNKIYVVNADNGISFGTVTVIDGVTNNTTDIGVGRDPSSVAINPVTNRIYVTNTQSSWVTMIDGTNNTTTIIGVGPGALSVAVNPVTNKIYVPIGGTSTVVVINGEDNSKILIPVGASPFSVAVNSNTNKIYVTNSSGGNIFVIDGATNIPTSLALGVTQSWLAINRASNKIFAVNDVGNSVTIIDGVTNQSLNVPVGTQPASVAVNPITGKTYVTNQTSNDVTVITENPTQPIPLTAAITSFPGNTTTSLTPTFSGTANSTFSPFAPPPQNVYYQLDTWQGPWTQSFYNVPGMSWSGNSSPLSVDAHILYAFAADNQDAGTVNPGFGSSPLTGEVTAYYFVVSPPLAIITPSLPEGEVGTAYSRMLSANGGTWSGYLWSALTSLPAGLTLTPGGLLSGTPTASGFVNLSLHVNDSGAGSATRAYSFQIFDAVTITTASLPDGEVGLAYNQTLSASNGSFSGYTWSVASGLPAGLTFSAAGVLSGTPTVSGAQSFTARVTDSVGGTATRNFVFTIFAPLTLDTLSLPDAEVWSSYNQPLASSGGSGVNFWSAPSGMPSGMGLNGSTGEVFGSPNTAGPASFAIQVQDSLGATALRTFNITIHPQLVITTSSLPAGEVSFAYSQSLAATGGSGGYVWSVISGLPDGLTFSAAGLLSGIPTTIASYTFNARVTDSLGYSANVNIFINIYAALTIASPSVPDMIVNTPQNIFFYANGGASGHVWSVESGLPAGLALSAFGELTGTPTAVSSASLTVRVTDSLGYFVTRTYAFEIYVQLAITTASLPDGEVSFPYSATLAASGGTGGNVWSAPFGTPPGLTLSAAGLLDGTPTSNAPVSVSVRVTDNRGHTANQSFNFNIYSALNISTASLPDGEVNAPYNQSISSNGGSGGNVWSVDSGLPTGLTFTSNGSFASLTGTPSSTSSVNLTVRVTDSLGYSVTRNYLFELYVRLAIDNPGVPDGEQTFAYSHAFTASGGTGGNVWSTPDPLPSGLALSAAGLLSGTPLVNGFFSFRVIVTDNRNHSDTAFVNMNIYPAIAVSTASLPDGEVSLGYNQTLAASGGSGGEVWSVDSGLPAGMNLSVGGMLSGTPTTSGPVALQVRVTDDLGHAATATFNFTIHPAITVTTATLPDGEVGLFYNQTLNAGGGSGGNIWSVDSGLPAGLFLSAAGQLSGTPSASGAMSLTVRVTDSIGGSAPRTFNFTIFPALAITTTSLPPADVGISYSVNLAASGGSGGNGWSALSGLPDGLTFSAGGLLSGTPTTAGPVSLNVQVMDSLGAVAAMTFNFTIAPPVAITTASLANGEINLAYSRTLASSGGSGGNIWNVVSGMPSGLTLSAAGVLSGVPSSSGAINLTVRVTDMLGSTATRTFSFTIYIALTITTASIPNGSAGVAYATSLAASGGSGGNAWSLASGQTPSGLSFSASGVLSGTPLVGGSYNFTARVTDSLGATRTRPYTLVIAQPLAIVNPSLTQGVVGEKYPYTALQVAGGFPQFVFSVTAGDLPPGITMNSNGQFTGTPDTVGSYPVTFTVSDATNATASRAYVMVVALPPNEPLWASRGRFGGKVQDIRVSPDYANDRMLLAMSEAGELFRSGDKGVSWSRSLVNPARAYTFANRFQLSPVFSGNGVSPDAQTVLFASYDAGVWKSTDRGDTFAAASSGIPCGGAPCGTGEYPQIIGLAISPNFVSDRTLWAADFDNILFRSTDGGANWTQQAILSAPTGGLDTVITPSPNVASDRTLFIGISNRVLRSLDGGATWTQVYAVVNAFGQPLAVRALVVSPSFASDHTLLVEAEGFRLYRTRDRGVNFADISTPASAYGQHLRVTARPGMASLWTMESPNASAFVYRLLTSEDYGTTFTPLFAGGMSSGNEVSNALAPAPPVAGAIDFYYATEQGLYASYDNGFSFEQQDNGLGANVVYNAAGSGDVVTEGYKGGWFKSADRGATRTRLAGPNASSGFKDVYFSAVSPDYPVDHVIFLGDALALMRSENGGQSFVPALSAPANNMSAAFMPGFSGAPGATVATMYLGTDSGLFRSNDGGRSFFLFSLPSPTCSSPISPAIQGVAIAGDGTIFVASAISGADGGLCKSVDGGANWSRLLSGGQPVSGPVALSGQYNDAGPDGPARTLMVYQLRSTDGGATWAPAGGPANLNGTALFSPALTGGGDPTVFLYGDGIFRSSDFGASFSALGAGDALRGRTVTGLTLPAGFDGRVADGVAVAATNGSGVYRSTDGGRSFAPSFKSASLEAVVNDLALASGGATVTVKNRAGQRVNAITADSLFAATQGQGVFQSDDGGVTFTSLSAGLPANADARAITVPSAALTAPVTAVAGSGLWRLSGGAWSQIPGLDAGTYTQFLEDDLYLYATRADGVSLRADKSGGNWTPLEASRTDLVAMDYNPDVSLNGKIPDGKAPAAVTASLWSVSAAGGALYSLTNGGAWITANGGGDYTLPSGPAYRAVRALGINAATTGREVIVGTGTGLYKSADGGASWREVSGPGSGLESSSKNFAALLSTLTSYSTTDVLVGAIGSTTGGVYLSGDGGEHWTQINQGFDPNSLSISTLVKTSCSGCPVQYYTGTYGSGVYTRTIAVNPPPQVTSWCFGSTACACTAAAGSGPEEGGQPFRLCGANFLALPTVEFDGVPASGCAISGATVITCSGTPPHIPGAAVIKVRNTDTRAGTAATPYTYTAGTPRVTGLLVAKSGLNAQLSWSCIACTPASPARIFRGQDALLTLNRENYTSATPGSYSNTGALAMGSNSSYFWSVE